MAAGVAGALLKPVGVEGACVVGAGIKFGQTRAVDGGRRGGHGDGVWDIASLWNMNSAAGFLKSALSLDPGSSHAVCCPIDTVNVQPLASIAATVGSARPYAPVLEVVAAVTSCTHLGLSGRRLDTPHGSRVIEAGKQAQRRR